MKINLSSVLVDDQDKALKFHTEVLGFVKKTEIRAAIVRGLPAAWRAPGTAGMPARELLSRTTLTEHYFFVTLNPLTVASVLCANRMP